MTTQNNQKMDLEETLISSQDVGGEDSCYRCGQQGHKSRECPPKEDARGGGHCYRCGQQGHKSRKCPLKEDAGGGGDCYRCGKGGHKSRECPLKEDAGGGGDCYRCGKVGHKSRECPLKEDAGGGGDCYRCGKVGHKSRECPLNEDAGGGGDCYRCGQQGHKSRECPLKKGAGAGVGGDCYRCGQQGHKSRDCPLSLRSEGGGGEKASTCYICDEEGHKSFRCPKKGERSEKGKGKRSFKETKEKGKELAVGPNIFVGFQVSNSIIHKSMREVQDGMVSFDEKLKSYLVPIAKSHITLLVARVNEEDMEHAIQVVRKGVEKIKTQLRGKVVYVSFEGIGSFDNRVVFANPVTALEEMKSMRDVFLELFTQENILVTDTRFNAHLTLAKIRGRAKIPADAYSSLQDIHFGIQSIRSIQLLSMIKPENEKGYYFTECEFMLDDFEDEDNEDGDHNECCVNEAMERD